VVTRIVQSKYQPGEYQRSYRSKSIEMSREISEMKIRRSSTIKNENDKYQFLNHTNNAKPSNFKK
jgi:hypothetical protein